MSYIYSIIRKDIPLADQIVQTAHSAFHAGQADPKNGAALDCEIPSLVLLQVPNEEALLELHKKLKAAGIVHSTFHEPDDDMGWTSITTVSINQEDRKLFSNLPLWRP
jgi:peptidyl-tRNA hydrolase